MDLQGPVSVDEEVAALSRSADRDSLFMQAALTLSGRADPLIVRVRNLSAGGMLAETTVTNANVESGAAVEVELRNVGPVAGRVVWVGEGKLGIAFGRQINTLVVRRQVVRQSDMLPHVRWRGREPNPSESKE